MRSASTTAGRWLHWVEVRDRGLLARWTIRAEAPAMLRQGWVAITHCGGACAMIGAVVAPLAVSSWPRSASLNAGVALASSHVAVQMVKRTVSRSRPETPPVIRSPDRFSFPSGHATAALAVTASYALAFPALALPLLAFGLLIGWSRVVLGVHYPGDVVVGQLMALGAVVAARVLL